MAPSHPQCWIPFGLLHPRNYRGQVWAHLLRGWHNDQTRRSKWDHLHLAGLQWPHLRQAPQLWLCHGYFSGEKTLSAGTLCACVFFLSSVTQPAWWLLLLALFKPLNGPRCVEYPEFKDKEETTPTQLSWELTVKCNKCVAGLGPQRTVTKPSQGQLTSADLNS